MKKKRLNEKDDSLENTVGDEILKLLDEFKLLMSEALHTAAMTSLEEKENENIE